MKQRKSFVVGNWKMNGDVVSNEHLFTALRAAIDRQLLGQVDVAICPPAVYLGQAAAWLGDTDIVLGAQNLSGFPSGAYTGEISATMLVDLGCRWVLIGHSERRTLLNETDDQVAAKLARAIENSIGAIVCVGETLEQRDAGQTEQVIARQVNAVIQVALSAKPEQFVIAYEPVWAIGTGKVASPEQAQAVHKQIRELLAAGGCQANKIRLLYGGSVKAGNAIQLFAMADIDGGLIGGASLIADDFVTICRAASLS